MRTLTPEQKARKAEQNLAWRKRNPDKIRAYDAKYRAIRPEKQKQNNKTYYAANADKRIAAATAWAKANPERARANSLRSSRRNAGVDPVKAESILREHSGMCDCCGRSSPGGRYGWNVDHDHTTGVIRGVLCFQCNVGIGKLGDTLEGVMNAVRYLSKEKLNG